jgi:5-methylcytosine-specific restriction endonuclease McrA
MTHDALIKRIWYLKNKKRVSEYNREYLRKWRLKNGHGELQGMTEYMRGWRNENPQKVLLAVRKWQKKNIEKVRAIGRKATALYKARKLKVSIGVIDYGEIIRKSKGICGICKKEIIGDYQFDHIYPISKGGRHTQDNLQLAHPSCNVHKSNKIIIGKEEEWQTL